MPKISPFEKHTEQYEDWSKKEPEKIDGFKKFLEWLASGANELSKGKTSCPS